MCVSAYVNVRNARAVIHFLCNSLFYRKLDYSRLYPAFLFYLISFLHKFQPKSNIMAFGKTTLYLADERNQLCLHTVEC